MKKLSLLVLVLILLIPVLAFSDSQDTLKKAIGHIVSVQDESGGWSRLKGEFPAETEPTAWAVRVLAMNGAEPGRVEKGVNFILKDQKPDGSWNNNTAHTGFAILALKQVKKGDEAIKKGVEYLRRVQDGDGGFQRIGKEGPPLTIYTAVVLCALEEAGCKKTDPMVAKAIDWLIGCQNGDGGYGMPKGSPSLSLSTGWVVRALVAYGAPESAPSVRNAAEYMLKTQKPSGGFAPAPPAPEDPEATAYVLLGLNKLKDRKDPVDKAVDYLAKAQQPDGAYVSSMPVQFNKVAKKNTQTTAFVAWALSELKP
jgi:prenyltransferase beta subunit